MNKYATPQEILEMFKRACAEAKARDKQCIEGEIKMYSFNKQEIPVYLKDVSAVYAIVNSKNGKIYIGSSEHLRKRFLRHISNLSIAKNHHCKSLQADFNIGSVEDFSFLILEFCNGNECFKKEQMYLDVLYGKDFVYNENPQAIGIKHTLEIKERMSRNHTDVSGEKNYFYGKHFVGESNGFYGKKHSEETKKHLSMIHKGQKLSEEHKLKISENSTVKVAIIDILTGFVYNSLTECSRMVHKKIYITEYGRYRRYKEFSLLSKQKQGQEVKKVLSRASRYIVRLSDNKIYPTLVKCIKDNNISKGNLYKHLNNLLPLENIRFSYIGEEITKERFDDIIKYLC